MLTLKSVSVVCVYSNNIVQQIECIHCCCALPQLRRTTQKIHIFNNTVSISTQGEYSFLLMGFPIVAAYALCHSKKTGHNRHQLDATISTHHPMGYNKIYEILAYIVLKRPCRESS